MRPVNINKVMQSWHFFFFFFFRYPSILKALQSPPILDYATFHIFQTDARPIMQTGLLNPCPAEPEYTLPLQTGSRSVGFFRNRLSLICTVLSFNV